MMRFCLRSVMIPLSFLLLALSVSGCGEARPTTTTVIGKVSYKGQPLTKGQVSFVLKGQSKDPVGQPSRPAVSGIGPDGTYKMGSFQGGDGVVPGEYLISVRSFTNDPTLEEMDAGTKRISAIPERYADPATSELTLTIPADATGEITHDIELKD